ncbi:MAG TPA: B12-binding domain-containing radical SAM protein [Bryobacteraceae bacterium]
MRYSIIYVVNPPSPPNYVSNKDSMGGFGQLYPIGATLFPPLDLIYLGSNLAEQKFPVKLLECLALGLTREQLVSSIAQSTEGEALPALVVVRTSAPTLDWDLEICRDIKKNRPSCHLLIYGPVVASVLGRIQKESCIDYIVKGDPDETVEKVLVSELTEVPGLTYRNPFGWTENNAKPFIKDLDHLPFPKWELLPFEQYQMPKSSAHANVPFLPMWTSRGCPIGCHYCPYPVGQGLPWRARSAKNVLDEIEHLVKDLGIRYILFRDPMFSLNQRRVLEICKGVEERGLKFEWRCETRVDFLNEETLRAMAKAGCEGINFGVESADVAIQKGMGRKPIGREQFKTCVALCKELHIKTFAFFIIGLPGDTVQTILQTIKLAIDLNPDWVQFTAAAPFIGTKLRAWAVTQGFVPEDEYAYINSHEVWIGNENLTKEQVRALYRFARFFQTYLLNRRGILKKTGEKTAYRIAKSMLDGASASLAQMSFRFGSMYLERMGLESGQG